MKIYEFLLSLGFWQWSGFLILVSILSVFLVCLITILAQLTINLTFRPFNRFLRSRNIKNSGWPPEHCDADGDLIGKKKTSRIGAEAQRKN